MGYPYQQWYAAAALGYQFKSILRPHLENIDPDKEHHFLFGGGYEFLRTIQSGKVKDEDRITIEVTPGFRLRSNSWCATGTGPSSVGLTGSTRQPIAICCPSKTTFLFRGIRFTPYGAAEVFYDGARHSWNEEWYTAGVQWPYKHLLMLDTYYRRENCPTCSPAYWNVGGVTLNLYFKNTK